MAKKKTIRSMSRDQARRDKDTPGLGEFSGKEQFKLLQRKKERERKSLNVKDHGIGAKRM